jgi:hypothetical protein
MAKKNKIPLSNKKEKTLEPILEIGTDSAEHALGLIEDIFEDLKVRLMDFEICLDNNKATQSALSAIISDIRERVIEEAEKYFVAEYTISGNEID